MKRLIKSISKVVIIAFLTTNLLIPGTFVNAESLSASTQATSSKPSDVSFKKEILVKFKDSNKSDSVKKSVKSKLKLSKLHLKKKSKHSGVELLEIDKNDDMNKVINELNSNSDVEYAQPNYLLSLLPIDNPTTSSALSLGSDFMNSTTSSGISVQNDSSSIFAQQDSDISTSSAINNKKDKESDKSDKKSKDKKDKSSDVIVGIIDTGIDINHLELKDSIYHNSKEISGNGIDDDNNGYIDDINGWDFYNNDNTVYDSSIDDQHGTHVAGIIAASENYGGITGVAPNAKILPLKFINGRSGYTSDAIEAIEYAQDMGVKIVNCSWGGTENNPALKDAIDNSGILFICAAGNNGLNIDTNPIYPAAFDSANIISVASVNKDGGLSSFSNYGPVSVDVAAPGENILSTLPGGNYGQMSGTSMAAPYVTGEAVLVLEKEDKQDVMELRNSLLNDVTLSPLLPQTVTSTSVQSTTYTSQSESTSMNNGYILKFYEDFENGISSWSNVLGTLTISTIQKYIGLKSYEINEDRDVIYQNFNSSDNKIVTLRFYDVNRTSSICMVRVDNGPWNDSYSWRGLGVDTSISTTKYTYRVGTNSYSTNVTRSEGWHELKWDYSSGTKVDMYIDGILVASPTGITSFSEIALGDWWGDNIVSTAYFDAISIYGNQDTQTDISNFTEDFENGFSNWTAMRGIASASTTQKYSGNMSYEINEDMDVICKNFNSSSNQIVTLKFYDFNRTSSECMVRVDSGQWNDSYSWRGLGVNTTISKTKYTYRVGINSYSTNVARSEGWHELKWDYSLGTKVDMYIDGILVASPTGMTFFSEIAMGDWWGDNIVSTAYFDYLIIGDMGSDGSNKPDLQITDIATSPSNPATGDTVTFAATVKNNGTAATSTGLVHNIDFTMDGQKVAWSNNYTSSIAPGASVTITANAGAWTATEGNHTISATADPSNTIDEDDNSNNTFSKNINVISNLQEGDLYLSDLQSDLNLTRSGNTLTLDLGNGIVTTSDSIPIKKVNGMDVVNLQQFADALIPDSLITEVLAHLEDNIFDPEGFATDEGLPTEEEMDGTYDDSIPVTDSPEASLFSMDASYKAMDSSVGESSSLMSLMSVSLFKIYPAGYPSKDIVDSALIIRALKKAGYDPNVKTCVYSGEVSNAVRRFQTEVMGYTTNITGNVDDNTAAALTQILYNSYSTYTSKPKLSQFKIHGQPCVKMGLITLDNPGEYSIAINVSKASCLYAVIKKPDGTKVNLTKKFTDKDFYYYLDSFNFSQPGRYQVFVRASNVPKNPTLNNLSATFPMDVEVQGTGNSIEEGLFQDADFDLNPEVQQLLLYYDDLFMYNEMANELGLYNQGVQSPNSFSYYGCLRRELEKEAEKLRNENVINDESTFLNSLGEGIIDFMGCVPYIGILFSDPATANAATMSDAAIYEVSKPENFSALTTAIANKYNFKYTIYELYEEVNGEKVVKYVGRTRQKNIEIRKIQHWADPAKNGLKIREAVYEGKILKDLAYDEARGLEQIVFEARGGFNKVNGVKALLNKIRPIKDGEEITAKILRGEAVEGKAVRYIKSGLRFLGKIL